MFCTVLQQHLLTGYVLLQLLLLPSPQVLPVYCYDPRFFAASPWGLSKTGPHRAAFLQACVSDLRSSLQQLGSGLLVSTGTPESLIASALEGCADSCLVLTQQEVTSEELAVDAAVRRAVKGKAQLQTLWGPSLYHIDDLPFAQGVGGMPNVFTPFRDKVEKQCKVSPLERGAVPGIAPAWAIGGHYLACNMQIRQPGVHCVCGHSQCAKFVCGADSLLLSLLLFL
mgnify:CR=1 FL=1